MAELVDVKTILKHIADSIKPIGFKKVGNRKWYRSNDETEQLVLLARFRFEPKHRVYMLGNILRFNRAEGYGFVGYHFSGSPEYLLPNPKEFMRALDQESDLPADERESIIKNAFTDHLIPLLERTTTEAGVMSCFYETRNRAKFIICSGTMRTLHVTPDELGW